MHIEILVEDSSGKALLESLVPKILGAWNNPHTWSIHFYKGIGRIPTGLTTRGDPAKRILLEQLPRVLQGYGNTPGIDAVVVVLDSDRRNCVDFLRELRAVVATCRPAPNTLFRLAIEEIEAWYLGDRAALVVAYPNAKVRVLDSYAQDSVCGTWEVLADAVYPGGSVAIKKAGWPLPGQVKHDWAVNVGPHLNIEHNASPSFRKFRDGLRRISS
jgi:hypothetical protein